MHRCGYIAIVGRPNVGKSTLLNRILGQKISITSRKPQTTRHRILGIKSTPSVQAIYVDTPGLHRGVRHAINRVMNRAATAAITDVDVVLFVTECQKWQEEDDHVLDLLESVSVPVILVLNKVDRLKDKEHLLPYIARMSEKRNFAAVVPVSATHGMQTDALENEVCRLLPESPPLFPEEQVTDRSERFLAAELVREKLTRLLGDELPYAVTVEIEQFKEEGGLTSIGAVIWVERDAQKAIVIGKQGHMLKQIGTQARVEMERLFGAKVYLQLWVKVKEKWSDDERALRSLGYGD
ncbi:MAG: GTPase Era [Gammaproteobacteria bacterium]|nr:GTPase Era [Gammaproteobacteria bacterium]